MSNHSIIDRHSALVNVKDKTGKYIYAGRKLTGFSNEEEDAVGKRKYVPFMLEDKARTIPPLDHELLTDWFVLAYVAGRTGNIPAQRRLELLCCYRWKYHHWSKPR